MVVDAILVVLDTLSVDIRRQADGQESISTKVEYLSVFAHRASVPLVATCVLYMPLSYQLPTWKSNKIMHSMSQPAHCSSSGYVYSLISSSESFSTDWLYGALGKLDEAAWCEQ